MGWDVGWLVLNFEILIHGDCFSIALYLFYIQLTVDSLTNGKDNSCERNYTGKS